MGYIIDLRSKMKDEYYHDTIIQVVSFVVIENSRGEILLQKRSDNYLWSLPGGSQELGESLLDTAVREIYEEANLNIDVNDLKYISFLSGPSRYYMYPNGDQVYNDACLFYTNKYSGDIKIDEESLDMQFFSLDNLPSDIYDRELIDRFLEYKYGEIL